MTTDPLLGQQIKGYRVAELLGVGGMGKVYRAEHPVIGKSIAVKLLHSHLAQDQETLARFLQEARAANQIKHDNIVDIIDFESTEDGDYFLLMEYLTGKTMQEALQKESPMAPVRLGKIGLQICSALYAAHQKGIIHRDLKAENVFLITHAGRTDFVKVLDFGVAKVLKATASSPKTRVGSFIGSPICIAPEQALGMEVDGRADIYSLGVLLYHMATGSPPFRQGEALVMLSQHLSKPAPPLRQKNSAVSQPLEALVLRCLEKNREARFASMKELARALADCCGIEMTPFFSTESVIPEVLQTTPSIVLPTRRLDSAEENKLRLTPLVNPPALKKAPLDLLPTTEVPQSSPKIVADTRENNPLFEHPEEEWTLSHNESAVPQALDTMKHIDSRPNASTVEHLQAQKKKEPPSKKEPPVSLEDLQRQETILISSSLEKMIALDLRQQETEHYLPSVKSAHPELFKALSKEQSAQEDQSDLDEEATHNLVRRQETVEIAQVEGLKKSMKALPSTTLSSVDNDLISLPSLASLPHKKSSPPWLFFGVLGLLMFAVFLYLLLS
jgi:serine/threonine protein kinase